LVRRHGAARRSDRVEPVTLGASSAFEATNLDDILTGLESA